MMRHVPSPRPMGAGGLEQDHGPDPVDRVTQSKPSSMDSGGRRQQSRDPEPRFSRCHNSQIGVMIVGLVS